MDRGRIAKKYLHAEKYDKILINAHKRTSNTIHNSSVASALDENGQPIIYRQNYQLFNEILSQKLTEAKTNDSAKTDYLQCYNDAQKLYDSTSELSVDKPLNLLNEQLGMTKDNYGPYQEVYESVNRHIDFGLYDPNKEIFYGNICYLSSYDFLK